MSAATMADVVMPMGLPCGRRVPKGNLRWYLLRVPEGREQSVCDLLKRIIPGELLEDAFAPRKERWAKRGGAWGLETVRMYRGYAFAATRDVSGLAKALARTTAAAELVGEFGRSWMPLAPEAQGWLEAAMDGEHVIRNSVGVIKDALKGAGYNPEFIQLISDGTREGAQEFMKMHGVLDVLIPRGSASLIRSTMENATVPVIETGTGNCHIYLDETADLQKALPILVNAKTQRTSVCNACESLVVDRPFAEKHLPEVIAALREKKVEVVGDEDSRALCKDILPATEEDFYTEFLALKISVKIVDGVDEAIAFINEHSTGHSEAIVTENKENAEKFLHGIDSACVYANASTRFTDGFEFGFGAEMGISTQKLHARGPMGLRELTSYKFLIRGNGQVRK